MADTTDDEYPTPAYIEPMLLAAQPYTLSGNRDSAATVAWAIASALADAGYVIAKLEGTVNEQDTPRMKPEPPEDVA